jgi:hypothetical protein
MKKYDTINLDWDGVLWDFMQAFCDWHGLQVPTTDKWDFYLDLGMFPSEFQKKLSELPQEFWQQEKYLMPHAHKLVEWARANAESVFVLTVAPEWSAAQGKQNLVRKHFDLGVYTVAKAEEKVEFAKFNTMLIDDRPSTVVKYANAHMHAGGYVWPAEYNAGLTPRWYFELSWLEKDDRRNCSDHQNCLIDDKPEIGMLTSQWNELFLKGEAFSSVAVGKFDNVDCDRETKESENMKPTNPKDIAGSSKVPVNSMISGAVKAEIAAALLEGSLKYGRHNYRQDGVRASIYYDALGRHSDAWWEGEDVDPDSGINHLSKAIAGLMILRDCQIRGMMNDDRPPKTEGFLEEVNEITKKLIAKYPNPVPAITEISLKKEN